MRARDAPGSGTGPGAGGGGPPRSMNNALMRDRPSTDLVIDDVQVTVRVRESPRARRMRLTIGPRRPPEVVVPRHVPAAEVSQFIFENRGWIARKLEAARAITERPPEFCVERPWTVWLAGKPVPITYTQSGRAVASLKDGHLVVGGGVSDAIAAIERWYRRESRGALLASAEIEASRLGVRYCSIGIRDQRTRWGSCSPKGHLSFSWRLVMAPSEVLNYLVVHELCHLRVANHSRSFWRLVESVRPDWREQARWLRAHGHELQDYRPGSGLILGLTLPHG